MKKLTTLLLCLGLMLTYACQDDRYDTDQNRKGGVTAKLNLHTPDYTQVGTRATNESAIMDVTILQFINGKLAKKITMDDKYWGATVETTDLDAMQASTLDANGALILANPNVMVFLANFKGNFNTYLSSLTIDMTYTSFLALNATLANAQALADLPYMPMTGFYYGGVIDGITNQINVSLTRALAKISFGLNTANFQVDGKPATVVVNSIELRNVPLEVTLFESNRPSLPIGTQPGSWAGTPKLYPATGAAAGGTGLPRFDASNFTKLELAHNQSATPLTNFVAYIPENVRGSFTGITVNKDKHPDATVTPAIPAGNNVGWTYIYVDLHYVNDEGLDGDAQYCIYLGGDAAGDMNILSGVQYNVTTNLYGANASDTRITVQAGFDPRPDTSVENQSFEILKQANSYIINRTDLNAAGKPLALPLTQARKGWQYIGEKVGVGTEYVNLFDDMIGAGTWEIVTLWKTENSIANVTGVQSTVTPSVAGKYHATLKLNGGPLVSGNNYVIALRSTEDKTIWWTWHLWVTNYNPDAASPGDINGQVHTYISDAFKSGGRYSNSVMMDRNLGATGSVSNNNAIPLPTDAATAVPWYGLLYQWGKKDPYTSSGDATTTIGNAMPIYDAMGNRLQASATTYWTANSKPTAGFTVPASEADGFPKFNANSNSNRLVDAVRMPYVYFYGVATNSYPWTFPHNDDIWGGVNGPKTAFDPCPPGWKVPASGTAATDNPWAGFGNGIGSQTTSGDTSGFFSWIATASATGRQYIGNNKSGAAISAWYPASGFRNSSSGAIGGVGTNGFYWAATPTGANGYRLAFDATNILPAYTANRAYGFPVRCVQE